MRNKDDILEETILEKYPDGSYISYCYNYGKDFDADFSHCVTKYDNKDRVVEEKYFDKSLFKSLYKQNKYDYNADGSYIGYEIGYKRPYKSVETKYNANGLALFGTEKIYNDKNFKKLSEMTEYIYDEDRSYTLKYIDYEKNFSRIKKLNSNDDVIFEQEFRDTNFSEIYFTQTQEYFDDGSSVGKVVYEEAGNYYGSIIAEFDSEHSCLSRRYFIDMDFKELHKTEKYQYNNGQKIQELVTFEDDSLASKDGFHLSRIDNLDLDGNIVSSKRFKDKDFKVLYYEKFNGEYVDKFVIEEGFHEYRSVVDKKNKKGLFSEGTRYKNKDFTGEIRTTYRKYARNNTAFKQLKCYKEVQDGGFNIEFEKYESEENLISSKKCKLPRLLARILFILWL